MRLSQATVAAEFARRAKQFYPGEEPMTIDLWGLFSWGAVSSHITAGRVVPYLGYTKENHIIWCMPSEEFYRTRIEPLMEKPLEELSRLAGWPTDSWAHQDYQLIAR